MTLVAALQMNSLPDVAANLQQAEQLVADAAAQGAKLLLLPEMFLTLDGKQYPALAQNHQLLEQIAAWARQYGVWLVVGAMPQPTPDGDPRVRSASLVFNAQGKQVARYDKIHLFDAKVDDTKGQYQESKHFAPGTDIVVVDTPMGKLGLAICFDLRFPTLFQRLRHAGAEIICLPAAFTYATGQAHWAKLLAARAIETQCYVLAANQCGWHDAQRQTWGHSQIIDPWGKVLCELQHEVGVALAPIDLLELQQIREKMPLSSPL